MKRITLICMAAIMTFFAACAKKQTKTMDNQKALVVFFSHAGENYSVGNIKVGNTKIVADYISELVGADQFEIVTHKYDSMAYKPLCDLAQEEQIRDERPEFRAVFKSYGDSTLTTNINADLFDEYDIIFVGGPVWWGTYPQVMFTFFDTYNLNGKTIYPFTTHEGSGLGNCVQDVKAAYPHADVQKGFALYGHEVRDGKEQVKQWLESIGF